MDGMQWSIKLCLYVTAVMTSLVRPFTQLCQLLWARVTVSFSICLSQKVVMSDQSEYVSPPTNVVSSWKFITCLMRWWVLESSFVVRLVQIGLCVAWVGCKSWCHQTGHLICLWFQWKGLSCCLADRLQNHIEPTWTHQKLPGQSNPMLHVKFKHTNHLCMIIHNTLAMTDTHDGQTNPSLRQRAKVSGHQPTQELNHLDTVLQAQQVCQDFY